MKRKIACLTALILLAASVAACGGGETDFVIPDYSGTDRIYEIGGYAADTLDPDKPEAFRDFKDAGFTISFTERVNFTDSAHALAYVDAVREAGFRTIVNDFALVNSTWSGTGLHLPSSDKNVHLYKDDPAVAGVMVCDEPAPDKFTLLGEKMRIVKELLPDKIAWSNIGGVHHNPSFPSYDAYLNRYLGVVNPNLEIFSSGDYPFRTNGTMSNNVFLTREYIKSYADRNGIEKTQYFILSIAHTNGVPESTYREPTEESLRFQLAASQVYGSDMSTYYTYSTYDSDPAWQYSPGIINRAGEKTALYYAAQTVNNEVHAWEKVYMSFKSGWEGVAAIDTGETNWAISTLKEALDPELDEIAGIKSITADGDTLIGIFRDADRNNGYLVLNAADPYEEISDTVTVRFDNQFKGVQVFEKGWPSIKKLNKNGEVTLILEPGEARFLLPLRAK